MSFGGASKWTEDYVRSLPTAPSVDSLGSTFKPDLGKVVRVDRKVYEWFGGDSGGWEEVFTIPSDYSTEGAPPEETGGGTTSTGAPVMVPPLSTRVSSSPVPSNPFYPMLVQEYDEPGLVDYSAYMPADSLFGYEQYQPYTNPNNIPDGIFNYQPPTIYATDPRAGVGSLVTPGGVIEGGFIRPTVGIEAATSSTPSSSTPVGSAGYPVGDPRNPEDRGGPDRPDGYVGADTDTQTRADLTVKSLYPNQIGITPPPSLYPNQIGITPPPETSVYPNQIGITLPEEELAYAITTPLPPRPPVQVESAFSDLQADIDANKARQNMLADIRKAEAKAELAAAQAAVAKAASDHQVELAEAQLAAAAQAAVSAGLLGGGGGSAIGKQIGRYGQLESVGSVYGNPGGRGNDMGGWGGGSSGGSSGVGPGGVGGGVGKGY
jgi:hypothetical protein